MDTEGSVLELGLFEILRSGMLSISELTEDERAELEATEVYQMIMRELFGPNSTFLEALISLPFSTREHIAEEPLAILMLAKEVAPDSLALKLLQFLGSNSRDIEFRKQCAIFLQNLLGADEGRIWGNLRVSTQSTVKCFLLERVMVEESSYIIKILCYTVSRLANLLLPNNSWPEFFPFIQECATSTSHRSNNSFFFVFPLLNEHICKTLIPDIMVSHSLFLHALNDDTLDVHIRILSLSTAIRFIRFLPSSNEKNQYRNLLPGMMMTLSEILSNGNQEVLVRSVLAFFINLAKDVPKFFRILLVDVVNMVLEIVEDKILEYETRHLAVEFVLTLVEARKKAPGMMKKLPLFTHNFFAILLNLLLDIKDEHSWYSVEHQYDPAMETNHYNLGRNSLSRFSVALGGKTIGYIAIEQLSAYVVAPEWEKRHAALMALSFIAEGISKAIKYLEQFVDMVLHSLQDPHPRVRWAAVLAITMLSVHFCPYFQEQYHNQVLPALAEAMNDFQDPRVQEHAALAVATFCLSEKPETLRWHFDEILDKLLAILQHDNQMVQQAALHALASLAYLSKGHFQKYYDSVMPCLKTILVNAKDKSDHMFQIDALRCISSVGIAAGKEKFRDDLEQVVEMLKSLQESQVKKFDTIPHILLIWSRICRCMGKDFLPYMSTVMPPLVEYAGLELAKNVHLTFSDKYFILDLEDSSLFEDKVKCTEEEFLPYLKSIACLDLALFAQILEEDFYPWIPQAASVFLELLKLYTHHKVRKCTGFAMAYLLRSAKLAVEKGTAQGGNESYFKQLSGCIILALKDALYMESKAKVCAGILTALNACLEISGPFLDEDLVHSIIDKIKHVIEESSCRKEEMRQREKSEDFDVVEAEWLREEREHEEEVLKNVGRVLISLIKIFKADFLPFFDELSSYLMPMKDNTAEERAVCIRIFNRLVENCGEAALWYYTIYLPFLLDSSNDENPGVRQNALYGLRLCAEYGSSIFKPFVGEALSRINVVITHFNALERENLCAYNNAVSALGKICQFHRESVDSAQVIPTWLNCLPIKADLHEAKLVHEQLRLMVERCEREVLGPNYEYLPKVVSVFAEVLCPGNGLTTEKTADGMINALRHLKQTLAPATMESSWLYLLPQQEMELKSLLSLGEDVTF